MLPIIVSDVKTMAAEVRRLGNGEVFVAEDVDDFVRATENVLNNPKKYRSIYTPEILAERSWERQAEHLLAVYNRIADAAPVAREHRPFSLSEPARI